MSKGGQLYDIPLDKAAEAAAAGYEPTAPFVGGDGSTYDLPQSMWKDAAGKGFKPSAEAQQLQSDSNFYNTTTGKLFRGGKDVIDYGAEKLAGVFSENEANRLAADRKRATDYFGTLTQGGDSAARTIGKGVTAAAPIAAVTAAAAPAGTLGALGSGALTLGRAGVAVARPAFGALGRLLTKVKGAMDSATSINAAAKIATVGAADELVTGGKGRQAIKDTSQTIQDIVVGP